jgi:cytochrome c biogenesis protein CcmG/thiol:disulfide interchange protein DsbE
VLWVSLATAAVLAGLVAAFAVVPQSSVQMQTPLLGKQAPGLGGPVVNGSGSAGLAALRGKWVLVNFFASWCPPCRDEMPQLDAFEHEHAAAGDATILGVEYDNSDVANARSYLAGQHADWPVIVDGSADVAWGVHGIPESYLVAPDGLVAVKYAGGITAASLDAQITPLAGAPAGPAG